MATKTTKTTATNGKVNEVEELRRQLAEAQEALAATRRSRPFSLKVSEKGGMSVYGLGRFPVTLYKEQWETLLSHVDDLKAFLRLHDRELKTKE